MPGCIFALVVGFIFIILSFVLNVFKMFWTVRKTARPFMNGDPSSETKQKVPPTVRPLPPPPKNGRKKNTATKTDASSSGMKESMLTTRK